MEFIAVVAVVVVILFAVWGKFIYDQGHEKGYEEGVRVGAKVRPLRVIQGGPSAAEAQSQTCFHGIVLYAYCAECHAATRVSPFGAGNN